MKTNFQQICRNIVFLTCLLVTSWVQAATVFNISFFDDNNAQVGQGQFSVDLGAKTPFFVNSPTQDPGNPEILFVGVSPLTSGIGVNFQNSNYIGPISREFFSLFAAGYWGGLFSVTDFGDRGGPGIEFGWTLAGLENDLIMSGSGGGLSGSGGWRLEVPFTPNTSPISTGTWTATAVTPIPAAVWLFASGLGALGVFRRKKA